MSDKKKKLSDKEGRPIMLPTKEECPCLNCKHFCRVEDPNKNTYMNFHGHELKHPGGLYCNKGVGQPLYLAPMRDHRDKSKGYDINKMFPDVRECIYFEKKEE